MAKHWIAVFVSALLLAVTPPTMARGSHGSSHSTSTHISSHSTRTYTPHSTAPVHVKGYTRKDGAYVQPHYRSHPDKSYNNNWSVKGNVNPYTGKVGTKSPTPDDKTPKKNPTPPRH